MLSCLPFLEGGHAPLTVASCSPSSSRSVTPRRTTRSTAPASAATTRSLESCPSVGLEASSRRVSCPAGARQSAEKPSAPGAVASGAGVEQRACVAECMRHCQSAQYKPSVCPPPVTCPPAPSASPPELLVDRCNSEGISL